MASCLYISLFFRKDFVWIVAKCGGPGLADRLVENNDFRVSEVIWEILVFLFIDQRIELLIAWSTCL